MSRLQWGEVKLEGDRRGFRRAVVRWNRMDKFIGQEENIRRGGELKQRREVTIEESAGEVQGTGSRTGLE